MDIIQFLYDIPLLGLLFQLIGYLIEVFPVLAPIVMTAAVPVAFAALCGVLCERSGVVNIGIEGTMLTAAFVGWAAGAFLLPVIPGGNTNLGLFDATPVLLIALALAVISGVLVSLLHAWLSISVKADQIIAGTIINIAAIGITGYLNTLIARQSPQSAGQFSNLAIPSTLTDLPFVGWIFSTLFAQGPMAILLLIIVIGFQVTLWRSRWGLRTRSAGEHPRAAETVGIDVIKLRYRNVMIGGVLAALGGAYLSMDISGSFQYIMTNGRGFIGLAAVIVGRWSPVGAFGAALLFMSAKGIGDSFRIVPPGDELGQLVALLPQQTFDALPYVITIIVLAGVIGRTVGPAAAGQPYERESAH